MTSMRHNTRQHFHTAEARLRVRTGSNRPDLSAGISKMSDDAENPKPAIEDACKPECMKQLLAYQRCTKRIKGHQGAHCTGQYFDYWECVDKCTAPRLFSVLK